MTSHPDDSPRMILQDVPGDTKRAEHTHDADHDHATEVAHAWEHFRENAFFFCCLFFPVIVLTVISFNVNFGNTPNIIHPFGYAINLGSGNLIAALIMGAVRSGLIAYFLSTLFKNFSFVYRTLAFTLFFLAGMIWLSLWDSEVLPGTVGDPIYDHVHPESMNPNY